MATKKATKKKRVVKKVRAKAGKASKKAVKRPKARAGIAKKGTGRKAKPKAGRKASKAPGEISLVKIGEVSHYFPHVNAAAVKILRDSLRVGDEIYIKGHTSDFKEKVESIQLDHVPIQEGRKGQEIGLFVKSRVRIGDSVYKV